METIEWQCSYCNTLYKTEDIAQQCAENCAMNHIESPTKVISCACEICGKSFRRNKTLAARCEQEHKERGDNAWLIFQDKQSKERLMQAAAQPGQLRLMQ